MKRIFKPGQTIYDDVIVPERVEILETYKELTGEIKLRWTLDGILQRESFYYKREEWDFETSSTEYGLLKHNIPTFLAVIRAVCEKTNKEDFKS